MCIVDADKHLMIELFCEAVNYFRKNVYHIEAAFLRCSYKNVFWRYIVNLKESAHVKMRFQ